MKVALVYDRVNKWGGAEQVLLALHKLFPKAPLYTSVYNKKTSAWAEQFDVHTTFLQRFSKAPSSHERYAPLMPIAFESFSFQEFDVVISVTSEASKGILVSPKTLHICVCLTPTRYLWSGYDEYFTNPYLRTLSKPVVAYLRKWDIAAASRPDSFVAISDTVKQRIKKYYNRDSTIIYPPVIDKEPTIIPKHKGNYYLVVSRLVPYKKIDLAIRAANRLQIPLRVIGEGSMFEKLKTPAGPSVNMMGRVTEEELITNYINCRALIFCGIEDFGLMMVEAQKFGKPVIAYRGGAAVEIVNEGVTGELFDEQTVSSLCEKIVYFEKKRYNTLSCRKNAERFSLKIFEEKFLNYFNSLYDSYFNAYPRISIIGKKVVQSK